MTPQILFVLALVVAAAVVLVSDRMRPDLVALLLLVILGLTGLVEPDKLFSGFSRSAVITIIGLFIITEGLERTGATRILGQRLQRVSGGREGRAVLVVMAAGAALSLVMNTIAAAAVLLPAVIGITRQTGLRPSRLLIPLSFGVLLGGMATLFTTANILVSAALVDQGFQPYGVLDFIPLGAPMALVGIGFMAFVGRRLLPERELGGREAKRASRDLSEAYGMREAVCACYVRPGSAMAGLSLEAGQWGERLGLNVVGISRGGAMNLAPAPEAEVLEGDVVLFTGFTDEEELSRYGLVFTRDPSWQGRLASEQVSLMEAVLAPRSSLAGKTLREIQFRERYDLSVLAIWREGNTLRDALGDLPLRFGDALLIQGRRSRLNMLRNNPNFLILEEEAEAAEAGVSRKAWLAVALTTAAVTLPALNLLPIAEAVFAAAALMLLFNCLNMEQAYSAIEWKTIFLIAGMIPLGLAMTNTGAAAFVGNGLTGALGRWGPLAVAGGVYLATTLLTQILSGQVTPLVIAPIAIAAARHLGVDPRGMAMAVAMGCSTAFLTPISHSANMLVMGPGGYKFKDYARVGLPLTALMFVVLLVGLAVFWNIR
jgi:di/tricarboxylate transporter